MDSQGVARENIAVPNSLYNWILPKCNFSFAIHFTLKNLINV